MKKYVVLVALLAICLYRHNCYADESKFRIEGLYQKNLVESPEVGAIKYQFVHPVNYSTGKIDITIPLFTIECGSLSLPIYLSYNSSGIKVNEPSGWVGQNWTLHAEPFVSRSVKGHIDNVHKTDVDYSHNSYFWARNYLDNNFQSSIDAMPDEYYFSLLTGGGMFMYSKTSKEQKNGKYMCIPYDDVKVTDPFNLVSPDGTKYEYCGAKDFTNQPTYYEIAWHASKVTAANGVDCIEFSYGNKFNYVLPRHEDHITIVDQLTDSYSVGHSYLDRQEAMFEYPLLDPEMTMPLPIIYVTHDEYTNSFLYLNGQVMSDNGVINKQYYFPQVTMTTQRLSHIRYKGNDVEFITDGTSDNVLKQIIVKNEKGKVVKKINLSYSTSRFRHYLQKISISSGCSNVCENYNLEYNNFEVLACGTRDYDFWGYYNGACVDHEQSIVPKMELYTSVYADIDNVYTHILKPDSMEIGCPKKRGSNEKYMRNGILKSITYPTGAKQTFVFEANRARIGQVCSTAGASRFNITDQLYGSGGIYQLGGLRIKEITTEDSKGTLQKQSFVYGEDDDGAGKTMLYNGINYFVKEQTKVYPESPEIANQFATARLRTLSSSPVVSLTYHNGSPVIYPKVTEYNGTPDSCFSKTIYRFEEPEFTDLYLTNMDLWDKNTNYSLWRSDNLKSKEIFEKTPHGFVLRESASYEYVNVQKNDYKVFGRQYRLDTNEVFSDGELSHVTAPLNFSYQDYSEQINANLLVKQEHKEFCDNEVILTQTIYDYGKDDIQLVRKITKRGENECFSENETYFHPQQMGNDELYCQMVDKNMLTPIVEASYSRNGVEVIKKTESYGCVNGSMYLPVKFAFKTPSMDNPYVKTTCQYDKNGNPIVVREAGMAKGIVWDEYGKKIKAIVVTSESWAENSSFLELLQKCTAGQMNESTTSQGETWTRFNVNAVVDDSLEDAVSELTEEVISLGKDGELEKVTDGECHITYFNYDDYGRIASIVKPNGQTFYYKYDDLHRLVEVQNTAKMILEKYVYHNKNIE